MPPKVLVITGPTATGKTALGIELCRLCGGEVVSADSMQIYRGMDIGTAKPEPQELAAARHHMINVAAPDEDYSVARYVQEASACADDILKRGGLPIIVGGTGLYIDSLVSGRYFADAEDGELRREIERRYDTEGGAALIGEIAENDRETAARLFPRDKKRIVRALEVYALSGKTMSQHNEETRRLPPRYDACRIVLTFRDRQRLYERINLRVDLMLEKGLEREVRTLLKSGLEPGMTAMQAIGYKEMAEYVEGKCSLSEAVDRIKQGSRNYAKRQLSWLRRNGSNHWIIWENEPDYLRACRLSTTFMEENGIMK